MSSPSESVASEPITDRRTLVAFLEEGCKPRPAWRIGTEHEKFAFTVEDARPLPYEGARSVRVLLEGLMRFGWEPVREEGNIIALKKPDGSSITLEPAGQFELSGAPLPTLHHTCREVGEHLRQVKEVAGEIGVGFLGVGYQPKWPLAEIPWMPKGRYAIMRRYMPTRGNMGIDMMIATCTVQVNLDFDSEATMVRMFRVGLALQPIATAIWANSPFKDGRPNGFLSYRGHVWTDVDPDRTGGLPFVFEKGFGFERYVDYMLDVPMYFVYRDGKYIDAAGQSFRDFMKGCLPALPGERPSLADWQDHLTTAFPDVRLKRYLEMRGADGGPWSRLCALPAFWVGLLYDEEALNQAAELVADWSPEERELLRREVPRHALATPFRGGTARDIARRVLTIASQGLRRRARLDRLGGDEVKFLAPLIEIVESGRTPAQDLLDLYETQWNRSIEPVFRELAY
jgi:glutamate--cysteine ligase